MSAIEKPDKRSWKYLAEHSHPWKKQLYLYGRKLPAASVWVAIKANNFSIEEAMEDWDLPREAVQEIIEYCESHKILLEQEAAEERRLLNEKGI